MAKRRQFNWTNLGDKLNESVDGKKKTFVDERFYKQKVSEDGMAQSIIRFLPAPDTDLPIATVFKHKFRGPSGGFYYENCPTTIDGGKCPVCEANRSIWATDEDLARSRSRKSTFIANILVVNDPMTPENNGKVFLFEFTKVIQKKIMKKIQPGKGSIEQPCIIFDYETGANFKLIGSEKSFSSNGKKIKYVDYNDASFAEPSKLGTEKEIDRVDSELFPIAEFTALNQFKTYDELADRFAKVNQQGGFVKQTTVASAPQTEVSNEATSAPIDNLDFESSDDDFINKLKSGS